MSGSETARAKVTVLLDRPEFERFDSYCKIRGFKKSTLIARLVREHLDAEEFQIQEDFFGRMALDD